MIVDNVPPGFNPADNPPPCVPISVFVDTAILSGEFVWACTVLNVQANLQIIGNIGIY